MQDPLSFTSCVTLQKNAERKQKNPPHTQTLPNKCERARQKKCVNKGLLSDPNLYVKLRHKKLFVCLRLNYRPINCTL